MIRWLAYVLLTVSLAAAVFLKGGVYAQQWEWSALGISLAALLSVSYRPKARSPGGAWGLTLMGVLLGWMILALVPLPPELVERLSPDRWNAVAAARAATGLDSKAWVALSAAPASTIERLLYVIPAMAAFVAAREMGWWWRGRMWIAVAPIVGIAWLESVLGVVQFYVMRTAGGQAGSSMGTYVNRNHFAGLLEMALPLAFMWAVATWRQGASRARAIDSDQPIGPAVATAMLLGVASCLLMGVILSLSRMGFISTLIAVTFTTLMLLGSRAQGLLAERGWRLGWSKVGRWAVPIALPLCILIFLPTSELVLRFADMSTTEEISRDTRMEIWRDTLHLVSAYKWTGTGLGAYERGLYRYKTVAPTNTVDFAHNDYLQILAELGIVGGALAAALAAWIVWRALSVALWMRGAENWHLAVGLAAALLTLGVHSLADFNFYIPANALAFAWLAGVAASPGLRTGR